MRATLTSVVVLLLAACGAANADLISNGGFETGDFTGWIVSGAAFNCGIGGSGISANGPHSGIYSACFANPDSFSFISQTLATTPGQEYEVSFWYAQQPPGFAPSNEAQISWGGVTVEDAVNVGVTPWSFAGFTAVASGTSTVLEFGLDNVPGRFALDDVSVDPVPEPQATILCGLGLGLLGLLRATALLRSRLG